MIIMAFRCFMASQMERGVSWARVGARRSMRVRVVVVRESYILEGGLSWQTCWPREGDGVLVVLMGVCSAEKGSVHVIKH
jgi:hypothetical protein